MSIKERSPYSDPEIDKERTKELEQAIIELSDKFEALFHAEMKRNRDKSPHILCAAVFAPISFILHIFETMHKHEMDPNKEFPHFFRVYKNYAETLGKFDKPFNQMTFKEFQAQFSDFYTQAHYAWMSDKKDE